MGFPLNFPEAQDHKASGTICRSGNGTRDRDRRKTKNSCRQNEQAHKRKASIQI